MLTGLVICRPRRDSAGILMETARQKGDVSVTLLVGPRMLNSESASDVAKRLGVIC